MSFPCYPEYKDSGVEWLGEVPAHWKSSALKHLANYQNGYPFKPEDRSEFGLPIIRISQLTGEEEPNLFSGEVDSRNFVRNGDLLFSWSATIDSFIWGGGDAWLNQHIFKVSASDEATKEYLYYLIKFIAPKLADVDAHGSTMRHIKKESLSQNVEIPPISEQALIARFLDVELGRVDRLVAEQAKLIALLKEKRQAVISHAVTKGLDPNVPMKDSGIEWLGDVPAHWEIKKLKAIVRQGTSITYGIVQAGPHWEGGIPYIKTSDMSGDALPIDGYSLTSPEIDQSYARSKVEKGDLVIAIRATIGKCLPVPDALIGANLTQGTAKISPGPDMNGQFLLAYIGSLPAQGYFDRIAKGATFREITVDGLRRTPVLVPPLSDQLEISSFIAKITTQLNGLLGEAGRGIALLTERRSALISAAITGKIDVRQFKATEAA